MSKFQKGGKMESNTVVQSTPFLNPTEMIKSRSVNLLFDCIDLHSKSIDEDSKYAFCKKVKSLSILLERYTPKSARAELLQWYSQLEKEIDKLKESDNNSPNVVKRNTLSRSFRYAEEVHMQNIRILMNSPVIELDVEGELDIKDEDMINIVRGGKRTDKSEIVFKQ